MSRHTEGTARLPGIDCPLDGATLPEVEEGVRQLESDGPPCHHSYRPAAPEPDGYGAPRIRPDCTPFHCRVLSGLSVRYNHRNRRGGADEFKVSGKQILEPGWRVYSARPRHSRRRKKRRRAAKRTCSPALWWERAARTCRPVREVDATAASVHRSHLACAPWKLPANWWTTTNCAMP